MKRPSFQFYPGDWMRDTALRSCSVGARGLWIDMLSLMHEGTPYGYLKVNHKVILPANLARMVGATLSEVEGWLEELEHAGVFSKEEECIYSRRMIRDENIRVSRAEGGIKGGNPALLKVNGKVNLATNLKLTPSSSSSSSSASNSKARATVEEIVAFCLTIGLSEADGEHCYHKWMGNGWINGKSAIKDWKSTVRSWKIAGHLPIRKKQSDDGFPIKLSAMSAEETLLEKARIAEIQKQRRIDQGVEV